MTINLCDSQYVKIESNPKAGVHLCVRWVSEEFGSLPPLLLLLHFTKLADFIVRFGPCGKPTVQNENRDNSPLALLLR